MTMKKIIAIVSIMVSVGILFACAKQKGVTARDFSVGMQMTEVQKEIYDNDVYGSWYTAPDGEKKYCFLDSSKKTVIMTTTEDQKTVASISVEDRRRSDEEILKSEGLILGEYIEKFGAPDASPLSGLYGLTFWSKSGNYYLVYFYPDYDTSDGEYRSGDIINLTEKGENTFSASESYSVTDKGDETSNLPETEAPVVEPLDTPEILCSDTIPAEE